MAVDDIEERFRRIGSCLQRRGGIRIRGNRASDTAQDAGHRAELLANFRVRPRNGPGRIGAEPLPLECEPGCRRDCGERQAPRKEPPPAHAAQTKA